MPQQVNGYHRYGLPIVHHVFRVGVVNPQILAETECLRVKPGLLKLYQDEVLLAVRLANGGTEINPEHRKGVATVVAVLMGAHLDGHNVLLQQSGQDGAGYALVLHQVLEYYVVYGVCYYHNTTSFIIGTQFCLQSYEKSRAKQRKTLLFLPRRRILLELCEKFRQFIGKVTQMFSILKEITGNYSKFHVLYG